MASSDNNQKNVDTLATAICATILPGFMSNNGNDQPTLVDSLKDNIDKHIPIKLFPNAEEAAKVRESYLELIKSGVASFIPVAQNITAELGIELLPHREITISYKDDRGLAVVNVVESKDDLVTIGRERCSVHIEEYPIEGQCTTSRVHLLIFYVPGYWLIVDVASISGFKIINRGKEDAPLTESKSDDRQIAVIGDDEPAIIAVGKFQLYINPKQCVVCLDKPRSVTFSCRHNICCGKCARHLRDCPICRKVIVDRRVEQSMTSLMPQFE